MNLFRATADPPVGLLRYMLMKGNSCLGMHVAASVVCMSRPQSIMLKNLPEMLLGKLQKNSPLCSDSFLLCSIMLMAVNV